MALIKSISGIRGTIGGLPGQNLTPLDVVKFSAAYGGWIKSKGNNNKIIVGRDGRISGPLVQQLVMATLQNMGMDIIDVGLSTTPTIEMAVVFEKAAGGIIITASHNPKQWNALKLLNSDGEFLNAADGQVLMEAVNNEHFEFEEVDGLGSATENTRLLSQHIQAITDYPLVNVEAIKAQQFKVVVDVINSSGAIAVPALLKALGVNDYTLLNDTITGQFAHNPEPLPQNLTELCSEVVNQKAHLGIAVDPDVDRLCFVCDDGTLFGEEYTLVAVADYILSHRKGNTVSNLSSTRALKDVTEKHGGQYFASAVGEVNVVNKMKEVKAVIGGEGNGGVIIPDLHYGRDALIGIALFLTQLAKSNTTSSQLRATYPNYFISKNKIDLKAGVNVSEILLAIQKKYQQHPTNTEDGLKIEFEQEWVHLRTSNTEPIIRVYAESRDEVTANQLAFKIMEDIKALL